MTTSGPIQTGSGFEALHSAAGRVWLYAAASAVGALMVGAVLADGVAAARTLPIIAIGVALSGMPRINLFVPLLTGIAVVGAGIATGSSFRTTGSQYVLMAALGLGLTALLVLLARRVQRVHSLIDRLAQRDRDQYVRDGVEAVLQGERRRNYLERELARARRYGRDLAVVVASIDNLHLVREHVGDEEARDALTRLGEMFTQDTRLPDGGVCDDLRLLFALPETPIIGARTVAERVRLRFSADGRIGAHGVPMTVSIGIASFPDDGQTVARLVAAASRALEHAESLGGNRSIMHRASQGALQTWALPEGEQLSPAPLASEADRMIVIDPRD